MLKKTVHKIILNGEERAGGLYIYTGRIPVAQQQTQQAYTTCQTVELWPKIDFMMKQGEK